MNPGTVPLLKAVLEATWQGSLVILLVLLVRPLLGFRVPARWRSLLWMLVLVRLLVPAFMLPRSPASLQNIAAVQQPVARAQESFDRAYGDDVEVRERKRMGPAGGEESLPVLVISDTQHAMHWWEIAALAWGCGTLVFAVWIVVATVRLHRRLGREAGAVDAPVLSIWKSCCSRFSFKHPPRLLVTRLVDSPALLGVWRPALLIPREGSEAYSPGDWEHIFMHELAHFRRRDHWMQTLQLIAFCVHWFNPLVWVGFRFLRADRELATDELALKHLSGNRAEAYGGTLLKVLSGRGNIALQPGLVGIMEDAAQLKQRLRRIVAFGPRKAFGSVVGLGFTIVLAAVVLGRQENTADTAPYLGLKPENILVMAASKGDLPVVRKLIDDGVDINSVVGVLKWEKKTALGAAAAANQMEVLRFLVSKGAQLNPPADGTYSAAVFALRNGWPACADYLIAKGAVVDPLAIAAAKGNRAEIDKLVASDQPDFEKLKLLCEIAATNGQRAIFTELYDAIRAIDGHSEWTPSDSIPVLAIVHNQKAVIGEMIQRDNNLTRGGVVRYAAAASQTPGMREWLISKGFKIPEYTDNERLIDATERQDLPEMRRLIKAGANVNYSGEGGWTPLAKAAAWGQPLAVKLLLENKANPNSVKSPGWNYSALCLTTNPEIADMLLAAGADINAKLYGRDVHIISYCVTFGPKEIVQWYIDHGVDPAKVKCDEPTLLYNVQKPDIAELLIQHGVDVNAKDENGGTALHEICAYVDNPAETVRVLLKHGADANAADDSGETPLMRARDGATVDVLVESGADLKARTKDGAGVIEATDLTADATRIEALIKHGVPFDVKTQGQEMLIHAAFENQTGIIALLLKQGADPNLETSFNKQANAMITPLAAAVVDGQYGAAKILIEHGAKVIKPGKEKMGEMINALSNGRIAIVRLFWEHGFRYISELAYAVSQGESVDELRKLLDKGVPVDPPEDTFISPLGLAARLGNLDAVKLLVARKANLNGPKPDESPLYLAAGEGQDEVVEYLLKHGAHANCAALIDAAGNSNPYNEQRGKEHFEKTARLLIDAGALKAATEQQKGYLLFAAVFTRQPGGNPAIVKILLDAGIDPESSSQAGMSINGKSTVIDAVQDSIKQRHGDESLEKVLALLEQAKKDKPKK